MTNTFAGLFRINDGGNTREVGNSEVTEFKSSHSFSYKPDSDVEISLSFWGTRGKNALKIIKPGDVIFAHGTLSFRTYKDKMYLTLQVNDYKQVSNSSVAKSKSADPVVDEEIEAEIPF